jgi:uncharacterized membrane protein (DUF485 family)
MSLISLLMIKITDIVTFFSVKAYMLCALSPGVTWAHVIELVRCAMAFVMLGIDYALASASDLAGLNILL